MQAIPASRSGVPNDRVHFGRWASPCGPTVRWHLTAGRWPSLRAGLWAAIAVCLLLSTGCAGLSRGIWPGDRESSDAVGAVDRPAEKLVEVSADPRVSPPPAVVPASFEESRVLPSPTSEEFEFLSDPLPDHGMTLEQVLRHTLDCHPLLHARAHEVEAARGRLVTAGLLSNPHWVTDSETPVDEDDVTVLSTRLTFDLPTGRKRRWAMAAAEAGVARSQAVLARDTELVLAEAADAAIEVLYLQELALLEGRLKDLAARTAAVVEGQFKAGGTDYLSAVKSRLDVAEIELARLAAQGSLEQARVRLTRAAGLPPVPLVQMRGSLVVEPVPALQLECLLAEAERCRPDLAESRAALLESQRLHAQARAEARPDITLGPRVQNNLGDTGDRVGARFAMDLPLFDRNQGEIAERAALVCTQRAMLSATEINTLNDVAAAYLQLQDAQTRLDFYHAHVQPLVDQTESAIRAADTIKVLAPEEISELLEQLVRMEVEQLELRYLHNRLRTRLEILLGCALENLQTTDQ